MPSDRPSDSSDFAITLHDELSTWFYTDGDLQFEGSRRPRITSIGAEPPPVPADARPLLPYGSRVYVDDAGAVRLCLHRGEPSVDRRPGSLRVRFTLREIQVAGAADLLWKLLRLLDGARTTEEVLADVPAQLRNPGARLLAALAAAGGLDLSGHPFRRFAHAGTKRGVLPVGELDADQIRRLATDGSYRRYPEVPRLAVPKEIPERLAAFYALTRARRSFRDFNGVPLARSELEALLTTACGVTGIVRWGDRELPLRAYPSGGALYPVEIYPVVFAVDGLDPGVYHYFAAEDALEVVRAGVDSQLFVDAALPPERGMLSGAAVLVCLSAVFERSERKYGEGVYRVIAAEAGHISENLLLAATALGLHGRPWGGIFDDLLNALLGFDPEREQFLLGVLVGHADGRRSEGPYRPVP